MNHKTTHESWRGESVRATIVVLWLVLVASSVCLLYGNPQKTVRFMAHSFGGNGGPHELWQVSTLLNYPIRINKVL